LKEFSESIIEFTGNIDYSLEKGKIAREYAITRWNLERMSENILNAFYRLSRP